jgi:hypothetical protein
MASLMTQAMLTFFSSAIFPSAALSSAARFRVISDLPSLRQRDGALSGGGPSWQSILDHWTPWTILNVGERHFFEIPKTWDPTLFWGVNQLGAGQRVERVSAEKGTRGRFWGSNRGQRGEKRESPGFYGIVVSCCGCFALEKSHRCSRAFTKFSPISRL